MTDLNMAAAIKTLCESSLFRSQKGRAFERRIVKLAWAGGSIALAALMPWRSLDRGDRLLMWAVFLGWPVVIAFALIELLFEQLFPRKPWWMRGGGP